MRGLSRAMVIALAVAVGLVPCAETAQAAQSGEEAALAKRRINLAGRQRMLSQRAARQICAAQAWIGAESNRAAARQTVETFETVLHALQNGGLDGLQPETNPATAGLLREVDALWRPYAQAVRTLANRDESGDLNRVGALNSEVLAAMNRAVLAMEQATGGTMSPELARAINVAGRQRMLIERATMWACLQGLPDRAGDATRIRQTIDLFEASLADLRGGNDASNIVAPPTWEIEAQLELVAEQWAEIRPLLDAAAAGTPVAPEVLMQLIMQAETLVDAMNEAVWMYETF